MNLQGFRLSISWSRIMPYGTPDQINQQGVDFYNNVIDKLIENGIKPYVTLYHFDIPAELQKDPSKDGWLNSKTPHNFKMFADFCFKTFGDRVKNWITLNEIHI